MIYISKIYWVSEVFKDKEELFLIVGDSKTVVQLFVVTLLFYGLYNICLFIFFIVKQFKYGKLHIQR